MYGQPSPSSHPRAPTLIFERDGERRETSLSLAPVSAIRPLLAVSLAFAASALWLILRGGSTPTLRAYFHAGMCIALCIASPMGSGVAYAGVVVLHGLWVAAITPRAKNSQSVVSSSTRSFTKVTGSIRTSRNTSRRASAKGELSA